MNLGLRDLTLTINSDGFLVHNSSKIEPWPVYLIINELGFKHRFSLRYSILLGVFYGRNHPNLNKILTHCLTNQMDIFKKRYYNKGSEIYFSTDLCFSR